MKFRAIVLMLVLVAIGVGVTNCGSSAVSGSEYTPPSSNVTEDKSPTEPGTFDTSDAGPACKKLTCADYPDVNCGPVSDGCTGLIDCGTCKVPKSCGGGNVPSQCGGVACKAWTCQDLDIECGQAGNGCGGTLECGDCPSPQICGGGGASKCGGGQVSADGGVVLPDGGTCTPRTTCKPGECGPVADGCGHLLQCNGCSGSDVCGGGGVPSMCGTPSCTKTTCAAQGAECGFIGDGCGGSLNCGGAGACTVAGEFCGGGGPNKCGAGTPEPPPCVNFCKNVVTTCGNSPTRVSGKVYAPNNTLPIPGALVYVPNGSLSAPYGIKALTDGVGSGGCDQCNVQASGQPLITTTTAYDGSFTLSGVPAGVDFPLVIQLGKWRRLVTIPATTACSERVLPQGTVNTSLTRLPRVQNEGKNGVDNIPLVAISTGQVDALECVFRKLGIDDTQFGNPSGYTGAGGRVRLYRDNHVDVPGDDNDPEGGAVYNDSTPRTDDALTDVQAHLDQYDAVIFSCAGAENNRSSDIDDRVRAYANKGGRVFATHWEYVYLFDRTPWNTTANWTPARRIPDDPWVGEINQSPGKRLLFSQWLGAPGVTALSGTSPPRVTINEARNDVSRNVFSGGEEWISRYQDDQSPTAVLHYTFNTPVGAASANQCGRVLYSDFHVSIGTSAGTTFPAECSGTDLTAQEKILAFFLFDLTSCIEPKDPPPPPTCKPISCDAQNIQCGKAGNGCGAEIDCGPCPDGQVCSGSPAKCVVPPCTPTSCTAKNAECGVIADGCGFTLDCGPCTGPNQVCGGNGPNKCGSAGCTPISCAAQNIHCGPAGNGCGAIQDCGDCPPGQTCGGGGTPGICGAPPCTPRTCSQAHANCGYVSDGCGGSRDCGPCKDGQTCGGGTTPNQCVNNAPK
jgi:hypothetical protein